MTDEKASRDERDTRFIDNDLELLKSCQKLEVKSGDTIVLKYSGVLTHQAFDRLKSEATVALEKLGFKVNVIVLDEGLDIGIFRNRDDENGRVD